MLFPIPFFHVLTALPRLLFPFGFHSATCLAMFQSFIRMTWLPHLNLCLYIACNMSLLIPNFVLIVSSINKSIVKSILTHVPENVQKTKTQA
jgi:mannose/fructose/N-acetylgalactosamine-specific phosphotransferase system component IIC